MDAAALVKLVLQTGIVVTVFALGLRAGPQDLTYLLRRPWLLVRSLLSMNVLMPLLAAAMVALLDLEPAVKAALIALAVSPVPPMVPGKAMRAGGHASYAIGLLAVAALLSVVFAPVAFAAMGGAFGVDVRVPLATVATVVAATVLAPLAAGSVLRRMAPVLAASVVRPASLFASVLLVLGVVPVLFTAMPEVASLVGDGTLLALAVFVLLGLAVGHLLGGPEPGDRSVLALVTSSRHPGVAVAIAGAAFPGQRAVIAAVLLYLLVNAVVSVPYLAWSRRRKAAASAAVPS